MKPTESEKRILTAGKYLRRLEDAQDKFNESINELSDDELKNFCVKFAVTIEPSKAKVRVQEMVDSLETKSTSLCSSGEKTKEEKQ